MNAVMEKNVVRTKGWGCSYKPCIYQLLFSSGFKLTNSSSIKTNWENTLKLSFLPNVAGWYWNRFEGVFKLLTDFLSSQNTEHQTLSQTYGFKSWTKKTFDCRRSIHYNYIIQHLWPSKSEILCWSPSSVWLITDTHTETHLLKIHIWIHIYLPSDDQLWTPTTATAHPGRRHPGC